MIPPHPHNLAKFDTQPSLLYLLLFFLVFTILFSPIYTPLPHFYPKFGEQSSTGAIDSDPYDIHDAGHAA